MSTRTHTRPCRQAQKNLTGYVVPSGTKTRTMCYVLTNVCIDCGKVISIKLKTCSGTSNGVVCTKVDISMNVSMSSFESFFVYGTDKVGVDLTMLMNTQVVKNRIMDCNCHTD